jgi:opacity protein-like surface antigen
MRALKQVSIAAAVLLLGASSAGAAGPYVGAHGGANWTHDGDIESEELSYELGYAAGASVGYKWDFNLRTELEATYRKNDFDELDTSFGSFDVEGDLSSWAFMLNAFYDFDTGTPWVPHLGIGLGLAVVTFDSAIEEDDTLCSLDIGVGIVFSV